MTYRIVQTTNRQPERCDHCTGPIDDIAVRIAEEHDGKPRKLIDARFCCYACAATGASELGIQPTNGGENVQHNA